MLLLSLQSWVLSIQPNSTSIVGIFLHVFGKTIYFCYVIFIRILSHLESTISISCTVLPQKPSQPESKIDTNTVINVWMVFIALLESKSVEIKILWVGSWGVYRLEFNYGDYKYGDLIWIWSRGHFRTQRTCRVVARAPPEILDPIQSLWENGAFLFVSLLTPSLLRFSQRY